MSAGPFDGAFGDGFGKSLLKKGAVLTLVIAAIAIATNKFGLYIGSTKTYTAPTQQAMLEECMHRYGAVTINASNASCTVTVGLSLKHGVPMALHTKWKGNE